MSELPCLCGDGSVPPSACPYHGLPPESRDERTTGWAEGRCCPPDPRVDHWICPECQSKGFPKSVTGRGCTFCDGTEGGNPPGTPNSRDPEWRPPAPSDSDFALAPPPAPAKALSPDQLLRLGALTVDEERSEAVERLVTDQEQTYRQILKEQGPGPLIEALLARDRQLATTGRQIADGRTATHLLREFMRAALQRADYASLRAVGDVTKTGQIERLLELLGGEPADARQLKLHGSTLGPLEDPARAAEALADGTRKQR